MCNFSEPPESREGGSRPIEEELDEESCDSVFDSQIDKDESTTSQMTSHRFDQRFYSQIGVNVAKRKSYIDHNINELQRVQSLQRLDKYSYLRKNMSMVLMPNVNNGANDQQNGELKSSCSVVNLSETPQSIV